MCYIDSDTVCTSKYATTAVARFSAPGRSLGMPVFEYALYTISHCQATVAGAETVLGVLLCVRRSNLAALPNQKIFGREETSEMYAGLRTTSWHLVGNVVQVQRRS